MPESHRSGAVCLVTASPVSNATAACRDGNVGYRGLDGQAAAPVLRRAGNVREVPFGRLETYDMGEIRIGRSVLQPGWRWSESIKPISRTELCEYHHIGVCISGRIRIQTREGAELTVEGGQFYEIPAGHEAWVEGDEPYVNIEWQPSVDFARLEGGDYDRVVSTLLVTDIVNSTARALELGDAAKLHPEQMALPA